MKCTVYNIGGELTQVLSLTCSKQFPMIPQSRCATTAPNIFTATSSSGPVAVMQDMLEDFPQSSFDLGDGHGKELEEWIASDALQSQWQRTTCLTTSNHFARVICDKVTDAWLEGRSCAGHRRDGKMRSGAAGVAQNLGRVHEPDHAARRRLVGGTQTSLGALAEQGVFRGGGSIDDLVFLSDVRVDGVR